MKRRVVVTGIGAVSPIGIGSSNMWENAKAGKLGIDFITQFDTEESKVKIAGEVKDFDPCEIMDKMEARRTARFTQFALYAAEEAFKQSGLDMSKEDALRCGVNVASGIGGLPVIQRECLRGDKHGYDRVSPLFVPSSITNMAAGMIAIKLGFKGSCTCVVTACASASDSIGAAFHYIRDGYSDVMACGGAEKTETTKAAETTAAASETEKAMEGTKAAVEAMSGDLADKKVGICIYQFSDNFMTLFRTELENYLISKGFKKENIKVMDGANDQATQTNQIQNFITDKVDVLIVNPVNSSSAATITDMVQAAGIPLVYINREPDQDEEKRWEEKNWDVTYVGCDARQSGTFQGEIIADIGMDKLDMNGNGKVDYIMIKGDPENIDAQ